MKNTKKNRVHYLYSKLLVRILLLLSIFFSVTVCGKRHPAEEENDPFLQLHILNFLDDYYSNSCQHPSLVLKKGESSKFELKLDEPKWFRFSPEGVTTSPSSVSHHSFFIQKVTTTEVSWITSSNCLTSPSYTYDRIPITAIPTELKFNLWNSDFISDNRNNPPPSKNGYYIKLISGDPNIIIRFE